MKKRLITKHFEEAEELALSIKEFLSDYSEREIDFIQFQSPEARMRKGMIENTKISNIDVRATKTGFIELFIQTNIGGGNPGYINMEIKVDELEVIQYEANRLIRFSYNKDNVTKKYFSMFIL
ncbi:MAG: hypothetical protein ACQEQF_00040 [Bacillota bacterium]